MAATTRSRCSAATLALPLDKRIKIFNIFGQGGVGKSTLLRRYREVAASVNVLTALANDDQTDVLAAMEQIAGELARQGHELRAFTERSRTYRQRRRELESQPDAPDRPIVAVRSNHRQRWSPLRWWHPYRRRSELP